MELRERFCMDDCEYLGNYSIHTLASLLDPRFKRLSFLLDSTKADVHNRILQQMQLTVPSTTDAPVSMYVGTDTPSNSRAALLHLMVDDDSDEDTEQPSLLLPEQELAAYLDMPKVGDRLTGPLQWWKGNHKKFPRLSLVARCILGIQTTSAPSERVFSCTGNLYSRKRMSLTPENCDKLIFLYCNKQFLV